MILNTGSIKFYNGFIHHSRKDDKELFFQANYEDEEDLRALLDLSNKRS